MTPCPQVHELYARHGSEVLHYLSRRCPDGMAADLLQETFLQVVRQSERLRTIALPRAWLFGIARKLLSRHFHQRAQDQELCHALAQPVPQDTPDPRLAQMREVILQLPDDLRETLSLRLDQGLSYEEIADVLEIPIGTVRSRLHHAVRRLRTALSTTRHEP